MADDVDVPDGEIIVAMYGYGGSFVRALAEAWQRADPINQAKLRAAFPEYWAQYRDLALLHRQREASR